MIKKIILFCLKYHIAIISILSVGFVIVCWFSTYFIFKNDDPNHRASFGGMFGGIESLFSGLAFCGIIITILLQSSELKMQRHEIKENRKELERTTKVQEQQSISLNRQAENLKISAKLSALNTLVNYYTEKAKIDRNSPKVYGYDYRNNEDNLKKAEKYLFQIEQILNRKEI
jgi:hypothetical protein